VASALNEYNGAPLPALPGGASSWLCLGGGGSVWTPDAVNAITNYLSTSASSLSGFTGERARGVAGTTGALPTPGSLEQACPSRPG
jgi:hypothetical protein